jgi:hypothetical protein
MGARNFTTGVSAGMPPRWDSRHGRLHACDGRGQHTGHMFAVYGAVGPSMFWISRSADCMLCMQFVGHLRGGYAGSASAGVHWRGGWGTRPRPDIPHPSARWPGVKQHVLVVNRERLAHRCFVLQLFEESQTASALRRLPSATSHRLMARSPCSPSTRGLGMSKGTTLLVACS